MRFFSLLAQFLADDDVEDVVEETTGCSDSGSIVMYVFIAIIIIALVAVMIISSRRNKKRQQESENLIKAVKPGNKVKTIGGICGIVVEVDDEESTFVLETGSEETGKYYIKFDRQAIYQTDAVPESTNPDDKLITNTEGGEDIVPLDDPYAGIDQIFGSSGSFSDTKSTPDDDTGVAENETSDGVEKKDE